jgi:hypothetical protein
MEKDNNGGSGGYMVRSLYFDAFNNRDLHDALDGLHYKGKIRLRIYSADAKTVKLEHKLKAGAEGIKRALTLTREEAISMISEDYGFFAEKDDSTARRIYMRLCEGAYSPASIVQYDRLAYLYPASDVRITFDTNIRTSMVPWAFFDEDPGLFPMVPPDMGVFEIKYNDFLPSFFKGITERLDLLPVSNSKYMQSRLFY